MSEVKKHEWPAFPVPDVYYPNGQIQFGSTGMALRDYFAAKAMEALIMSSDAEHNAQRLSGERGFKTISEAAYCAADAMLEARDKP